MFNVSSATNTSFGIPSGLGSNKKDLFNSSTSDFFDPPPPPGGPGGGRSPLFDRPLYQLVPYQVIDLSFLRTFEVFNSILNAFGDLFSSKTQIPTTKDLLGSKSPFPLHSKYEFSKLDAFDPSTIPPTILQYYGVATSKPKGPDEEIPNPTYEASKPEGPDEEILNAVKDGDEERLQLLLKMRGPAPFNEPDLEGMTPAHLAAQYGQVDVLRFLATVRGVNLTQPNNRGSTPAHFAAQQGHVEVLRFLAEEGRIDLNLSNNGEVTPAHVAAERGRVGVLRFLATVEGSNLNQPTKKGWTPAHYAAANGHVDILRFLAAVEGVNLSQPHKHGWTPAHLAAQNRHIKVLRFLKTLPRNKPHTSSDKTSGFGHAASLLRKPQK